MIKASLLNNGKLRLDFPYSIKAIAFVNTLKGIGFLRDAKPTYWVCENTSGNVQSLKNFGFELPEGLQPEDHKPKQDLQAIEVPGLLRELRDFQRKGVHFLDSKKGRGLIADDPGIGKTIQTIAWLHKHPEALPAVIIMPRAVKENWKREITITTDRIKTRTLSGIAPHELNPAKNTVYLINYDIFRFWFCDMMTYEKRINGKIRKIERFFVKNEIQSLGFKSIILDEVHMIKSTKSKRTKAALAMAKKMDHVIGLSGTPMLNKPIELWTITQAIDPTLFPSEFEYAKKYCNAKRSRYGNGWDFTGHSNTKELNEILTSSIMLRRKKEDVLKDLPPTVHSIIPIDIDNQDEYDRVRDEVVDWIKKVGVEAAIKAKKAEAIVKYEKLKQVAVRGKISTAFEWMHDYIDDGCQKMVAFAWHRDVVKRIHSEFSDSCVCPLISDRDKCVDRFWKDPKINVFAGNIQAEGVGINLQVASNVVKLEVIPSPELHRQAWDRCSRIGQKSCVNVWWMVAKGTIEEKILQHNDRKRKIIAGVLDGEDVPEENLLYEIFTSLK